ncbi:Exodeoxyribonuclease VII large subunit [Carboxydocella sporoproducens DSM 16521]|uniref:Exodeoxyribonuclease 7 large subunit n=2 Tax=Carboxydocella TaxID=178898 RepID=A0A1T4NW81_9FIRM|nr:MULTISPECIES: exodeoxyribonuclease VII large subunit [Carboxydocella]AVX20152.1 Exodeoxyribonuclease VII large subunit [Carboxydocella thermautotrophica]SJZ83483.1 Exodeoxyribonuclease VII large subunit [Carboxydocella sporoproducens DSM 16521]
MTGKTFWTVTELNSLIKQSLETNYLLKRVWIKGEIAEFTRHRLSGHCYFTLKDQESQLKCVMFRQQAANLRFQPRAGMEVLVLGSINVFLPNGIYQLYAEDIQPYGIGSSQLQLEQLKRKLEAEGLFSTARKRPLPPLPRRIALVTSRQGAAVRDMVKILRQRFPIIEIVIVDVQVQGEEAPASIKAGLELAAAHTGADLVIVGRGGGATEDLAAFNSEIVVRAIAACPLPVIAAIGHESDVTLADLVADVRASTPSNAAELAVPVLQELLGRTAEMAQRLRAAISNRFRWERQQLEQLASRPILQQPQLYFERKWQEVERIAGKLQTAAENVYLQKQHRLEKTVAALNALSPLKVLERGYAFCRREQEVVTSVEQVQTGQGLTLHMKDGEVDCQVQAVRRKMNG